MTAQVAETVLRVAVLLEAGVTPTRAWDHLAKQGDLQASQVVNAVDGVNAPVDKNAELGLAKPFQALVPGHLGTQGNSQVQREEK